MMPLRIARRLLPFVALYFRYKAVADENSTPLAVRAAKQV